MPLGSTVEFTNLDTQGNAISPPVSNQIVNFGWEYVFHCHILSHEEMDMMRPVQVNVATTLPTAPVLSIVGSPGGPIDLSWTDGTPVTTDIATWGDPANEIGFRVERAIIAGAFTPIATTLANATNFTDTTTVAGTQYQYRVVAFNTAGDSPSNVVATGTILRKAPPPDFNGNGATDIAVYRPSDNTWYPMGQPSTVWGAAGDILVPEDYNGDGKSEVATFRPSDGSWNIAGMPTVFWGINGDIPMPGDYNGDGKAEVAVFRPSENIWYIQGMPLTMWGIAGDIPVPADYNGDGKTEIAVFRPSENMWYVQGMPFTMWGITGDVLVPGDYNGDGAAEVAVYRPSENMWYVQGMPFMMWGIAGDTLVPGDYNGDGTTDIAVFRPSEGMWYAQGQAPVMWGISTDIPLSKKP